MHDCRDELRAAGSRVTKGRLALLALLERARRPLTVVEIQKKLHSINPVTLYRALEPLVAAGLVRRGSDGRTAHFEYGGRSHHHHLVCRDCGLAMQCKACA